MIQKSVFIILLSLFIGCGLPNSFNIDNDLNPPFLVETRSSNTTITLNIYSKNTAQNAFSFAGYNLYYDRTSNFVEIKDNVIHFQDRNSTPTVLARYASGIQMTAVFLEDNFFYSNTEIQRIEEEDLQTGDRLFFIARSVISANHTNTLTSSDYFQIYQEGIEINNFNATLNDQEQFSLNGVQLDLIISNSQLLPTSTDMEIQDMGYYEDWYDIQRAPTSGYITGIPLSIVEKHIYVYFFNNHYGKIYIISSTDGSIIYHISYQTNENDTEV